MWERTKELYLSYQFNTLIHTIWSSWLDLLENGLVFPIFLRIEVKFVVNKAPRMALSAWSPSPATDRQEMSVLLRHPSNAALNEILESDKEGKVMWHFRPSEIEPNFITGMK